MDPSTQEAKNLFKRGKRSLGWFATWPKCPLKKEFVMNELYEQHKPSAILVCEEDHQDGTQHLHAFIKFAKRKEWSFSMFDIDGYHGNYQPAKSWRKCEQYVKKEGKYCSKGMEGTTFYATYSAHEILTMDPVEAVQKGAVPYYRYDILVRNQGLYKMHMEKPFSTDHCRGVWVYGKSGFGKSHFARERLTLNYGESPYVKPQNKWWDGYTNQRGVLLDDFDSKALGHYLKIWLDKYAFAAEVKGGTICPRYHEIVITSQYIPEELWCQDDIERGIAEAIRRRCVFIEFVSERSPIQHNVRS